MPLIELDVERFALPITRYATSYFLTARLAARRMIAERVGRDHDRHRAPLADRHPARRRLRPGAGRQGGAHADLSAELAPHGIRVVGLRPQAMPETRTIRDAFEPRAKALGHDLGAVRRRSSPRRTHPRRLMTLAEMADVAAFMASDQASGMTGTTVNLTMGSLDD